MSGDRKSILMGLGIGMGLMYFVDPNRGRRRRAQAKDKISDSVNATVSAIGATKRDLAHRTEGVMARVRRAFRREVVDDDIMGERVRGQLGRAVSHPHAIRVEVDEGCVTLSGPILHQEVKPLLRAVARIRGVFGIVNSLDEHESADHVPALQGGQRPSRRRWAPASRLVLGTAGTALAGYGAVRRDVRGAVLAATGLGLVARAGRRAS